MSVPLECCLFGWSFRYFFFAAFFTAFFAAFFAGAFLAAFLVAICLFSLFDGLHRFCNCYIAVEAMYRIAPHRCQEKNVVRVEKSSTIFSGMEWKRSANRIRAGFQSLFQEDCGSDLCGTKRNARHSSAHHLQHSITFNARPARLVSL